MLISEMVQLTMDKKGIAQREMAYRMGWNTPQSISNIKRGVANIPPKRFKRFSKLSGYTIGQIIEAHLNQERLKLFKEAGVRCKKL